MYYEGESIDVMGNGGRLDTRRSSRTGSEFEFCPGDKVSLGDPAVDEGRRRGRRNSAFSLLLLQIVSQLKRWMGDHQENPEGRRMGGSLWPRGKG